MLVKGQRIQLKQGKMKLLSTSLTNSDLGFSVSYILISDAVIN